MNQPLNMYYTCILSNISSNASNLPTITSPTVTVPTMTNYSSGLYQIQFQYPSAWELNEKTSRFDEGTDISVSGFSPSGIITIGYINSSEILGRDLESRAFRAISR